MPRFSIVTTCKGRLHHLKQSLPRFLEQRDTEVIVVDYDCPDGTADYVRREHPDAHVVAVADAPVFSPSDARNRGAAAATGDWLAFVDADIIMALDTLDRVGSTEGPPKRYYRFRHASLSLFGTCVMRRADFLAVQGYDVVIQGYGGEDSELYARLERSGVVRVELDGGLIETCLEHSNAERVRFHRRKSFHGSIWINAAYRLVKSTLLQQYGVLELPEETRRAVYDTVRQRVKAAFRAGQSTVQIAVALPDAHERMPAWEMDAKRRLHMEINLKLIGAETSGE